MMSTHFTDFAPARYWIGSDVMVARKGLQMHHKEKMVKTHSQDDLTALIDADHDENSLIILYDPKDMKATRILRV